MKTARIIFFALTLIAISLRANGALAGDMNGGTGGWIPETETPDSADDGLQNDDGFISDTFPNLGKKIEHPIDPETPQDPEEPTTDDDGEKTENQWVEIVLNQSLLDAIAQDIIPVAADELGLNGTQSLDRVEQDVDVGKCHSGSFTLSNIEYHLPVSENTANANFAADTTLQTSWDFSEESYVTAKITLDAPRQALGHGATDDEVGCEIWEWILMGDLSITGDIKVTGIKLDADFNLGVKKNQVKVTSISALDVNPDDVKIEIDDLEGGGLIQVLVDMGIGIESGDFSCDAHSSFEQCLEILMEDELITAVEGDDIKDTLKESLNSSLGAALAVKDSTNVAGQDIDYSFSLAKLESTPDETSLITRWAVFLTNTGSNDTCADAMTFSKDMGEIKTYDAQGSIDSYVPIWLVEQIGYFIGKWGYFCAGNSLTVPIDGENISYAFDVKPAGPLQLKTGTLLAAPVGHVHSNLGSLTVQSLTDESLEEIPNAYSTSKHPLKNAGGVATYPGYFGRITTTEDDVAPSSSALGSKFTATMPSRNFVTRTSDSNENNFTLSIPIAIDFSGNASGTANATLSATAQIDVNDTQGLSLKIASVSATNISGSITISSKDVSKTVNAEDLDIAEGISASFKGKFDALKIPLLPNLTDFDDSLGLSLSIGESTIADKTAIKVPVTIEVK